MFAGKGIGRKLPFLWRIYDWLYCRCAPQKRFYHEMQGSKFLVDLTDRDYHMRKIMQGYTTITIHEAETTKLLRTILKPGDTVLDIGASIGYFTFLASKLVGEKGNVYAFEPTEASFKYLCENREANGARNVYPFKVGAWDANMPVKLPAAVYQSSRSEWVNGIVIDDFLVKEGLTKVDFVKMDIDGSEPWALRGLRKTIERNPQLAMVIEYYPKYISGAGGNPQDVLDILDTYFIYAPIQGDYGDGYWNFYCRGKSQRG